MGKHCLKLCQVCEHTLINLEAWLHDRTQAQNDPCLSPQHQKQQPLRKDGYNDRRSQVHAKIVDVDGKGNNQNDQKWICKSGHQFYICQRYKMLKPVEKF